MNESAKQTVTLNLPSMVSGTSVSAWTNTTNGRMEPSNSRISADGNPNLYRSYFAVGLSHDAPAYDIVIAAASEHSGVRAPYSYDYYGQYGSVARSSRAALFLITGDGVLSFTGRAHSDGSVDRLILQGGNLSGNAIWSEDFYNGAILEANPAYSTYSRSEAFNFTQRFFDFSLNVSDAYVDGAVSYLGAFTLSAVEDATFINVEFNNTHSITNGGAIWFEDGGSINYELSEIVNHYYTYQSNDEIYDISGKEYRKDLKDGSGYYIMPWYYYNVTRGGSGTLTIDGCSFIGNSSGTATNPVSGAIFTNNSNESSGGAIYVRSLDNSLSYTTTQWGFSDYKNGWGNWYYLRTEAVSSAINTTNTVKISNSVFTGNRSHGHAGAIYTEGRTNLTITDSVFTDNYAFYEGGAIRAASYAGSLSISGSTFSGNEAGTFGGAVSSSNRYTTVKNSVFTDNKAQVAGAFYASAGQDDSTALMMDYVIADSVFDSNEAAASGGAIAVRSGSGRVDVASPLTSGYASNVNLENLTLINNRAGISGGAVTVSHTSMTFGSTNIVNCTVVGNFAGGTQGRFYWDIGHGYFETPEYAGNWFQEPSPLLGGGGGIYVGLMDVIYANNGNNNFWGTWYWSGGDNVASAAVFLYNNLMVGNESRGARGDIVADDLLVSDNYSGDGMLRESSAQEKYGAIGAAFGFYNVIGAMTGNWQSISVNNTVNPDLKASDIYSLEDSFVNGKWMRDGDSGMLEIRDIDSTSEGDLFYTLNRKNFSIGRYVNRGLHFYAYQDTTINPEVSDTADESWYGVSWSTTGISTLSVTSAVVDSERIAAGGIIDGDGAGRKRMLVYSVGASQNATLAGWDLDEDGAIQNIYSVNALAEVLESDNDAGGSTVYLLGGTIRFNDTVSVQVRNLTLMGSEGTRLMVRDNEYGERQDMFVIGSGANLTVSKTSIGSGFTVTGASSSLGGVFTLTDSVVTGLTDTAITVSFGTLNFVNVAFYGNTGISVRQSGGTRNEILRLDAVAGAGSSAVTVNMVNVSMLPDGGSIFVENGNLSILNSIILTNIYKGSGTFNGYLDYSYFTTDKVYDASTNLVSSMTLPNQYGSTYHLLGFDAPKNLLYWNESEGNYQIDKTKAVTISWNVNGDGSDIRTFEDTPLYYGTLSAYAVGNSDLGLQTSVFYSTDFGQTWRIHYSQSDDYEHNESPVLAVPAIYLSVDQDIEGGYYVNYVYADGSPVDLTEVTPSVIGIVKTAEDGSPLQLIVRDKNTGATVASYDLMVSDENVIFADVTDASVRSDFIWNQMAGGTYGGANNWYTKEAFLATLTKKYDDYGNYTIETWDGSGVQERVSQADWESYSDQQAKALLMFAYAGASDVNFLSKLAWTTVTFDGETVNVIAEKYNPTADATFVGNKVYYVNTYREADVTLGDPVNGTYYTASAYAKTADTRYQLGITYYDSLFNKLTAGTDYEIGAVVEDGKDMVASAFERFDGSVFTSAVFYTNTFVAAPVVSGNPVEAGTYFVSGANYIAAVSSTAEAGKDYFARVPVGTGGAYQYVQQNIHTGDDVTGLYEISDPNIRVTAAQWQNADIDSVENKASLFASYAGMTTEDLIYEKQAPAQDATTKLNMIKITTDLPGNDRNNQVLTGEANKDGNAYHVAAGAVSTILGRVSLEVNTYSDNYNPYDQYTTVREALEYAAVVSKESGEFATVTFDSSVFWNNPVLNKKTFMSGYDAAYAFNDSTAKIVIDGMLSHTDSDTGIISTERMTLTSHDGAGLTRASHSYFTTISVYSGSLKLENLIFLGPGTGGSAVDGDAQFIVVRGGSLYTDNVLFKDGIAVNNLSHQVTGGAIILRSGGSGTLELHNTEFYNNTASQIIKIVGGSAKDYVFDGVKFDRNHDFKQILSYYNSAYQGQDYAIYISNSEFTDNYNGTNIIYSQWNTSYNAPSFIVSRTLFRDNSTSGTMFYTWRSPETTLDRVVAYNTTVKTGAIFDLSKANGGDTFVVNSLIMNNKITAGSDINHAVFVTSDWYENLTFVNSEVINNWVYGTADSVNANRNNNGIFAAGINLRYAGESSGNMYTGLNILNSVIAGNYTSINGTVTNRDLFIPIADQWGYNNTSQNRWQRINIAYSVVGGIYKNPNYAIGTAGISVPNYYKTSTSAAFDDTRLAYNETNYHFKEALADRTTYDTASSYKYWFENKAANPYSGTFYSLKDIYGTDNPTLSVNMSGEVDVDSTIDVPQWSVIRLNGVLTRIVRNQMTSTIKIQFTTSGGDVESLDESDWTTFYSIGSIYTKTRNALIASTSLDRMNLVRGTFTAMGSQQLGYDASSIVEGGVFQAVTSGDWNTASNYKWSVGLDDEGNPNYWLADAEGYVAISRDLGWRFESIVPDAGSKSVTILDGVSMIVSADSETTQINNLTIGTGASLTVNRDIVFGGDAAVNNGTLTLNGMTTLADGTVLVNSIGSNVIYSSTAESQNILLTQYYGLELAGSGDKTFETGNYVVYGDILVTGDVNLIGTTRTAITQMSAADHRVLTISNGRTVSVYGIALEGRQYVSNSGEVLAYASGTFQGGRNYYIMREDGTFESVEVTEGMEIVPYTYFTAAGAAVDGGAILTGTGSTVTLDTVSINNMRGANGGAIYASANSTLSLNNVTIAKNTATANAGAIYVASGATAMLRNTTVAYNDMLSESGNTAAGIFINGGKLISLASVIVANDGWNGQNQVVKTGSGAQALFAYSFLGDYHDEYSTDITDFKLDGKSTNRFSVTSSVFADATFAATTINGIRTLAPNGSALSLTELNFVTGTDAGGNIAFSLDGGETWYAYSSTAKTFKITAGDYTTTDVDARGRERGKLDIIGATVDTVSLTPSEATTYDVTCGGVAYGTLALGTDGDWVYTYHDAYNDYDAESGTIYIYNGAGQEIFRFYTGDAADAIASGATDIGTADWSGSSRVVRIGETDVYNVVLNGTVIGSCEMDGENLVFTAAAGYSSVSRTDGWTDYVYVKDSTGKLIFKFDSSYVKYAIESYNPEYDNDFYGDGYSYTASSPALSGDPLSYKVTYADAEYGALSYDGAAGEWVYTYTDGIGGYNSYMKYAGAVTILDNSGNFLFSFDTGDFSATIDGFATATAAVSDVSLTAHTDIYSYDIMNGGNYYGTFSYNTGTKVWGYTYHDDYNDFDGASGDISVRDANGDEIFGFDTASVTDAIAKGNSSAGEVDLGTRHYYTVLYGKTAYGRLDLNTQTGNWEYSDGATFDHAVGGITVEDSGTTLFAFTTGDAGNAIDSASSSTVALSTTFRATSGNAFSYDVKYAGKTYGRMIYTEVEGEYGGDSVWQWQYNHTDASTEGTVLDSGTVYITALSDGSGVFTFSSEDAEKAIGNIQSAAVSRWTYSAGARQASTYDAWTVTDDGTKIYYATLDTAIASLNNGSNFQLATFDGTYGAMTYNADAGEWAFTYINDSNRYVNASGIISVKDDSGVELFSFNTADVGTMLDNGTLEFNASFSGTLSDGIQLVYDGNVYGALTFKDGRYTYTYITEDGQNNYVDATGRITIRDQYGSELFSFDTSEFSADKDTLAMSRTREFNGSLSADYIVSCGGVNYGEIVWSAAKNAWVYNYSDGVNEYENATGSITVYDENQHAIFTFHTSNIATAIADDSDEFIITPYATLDSQTGMSYLLGYQGGYYGTVDFDSSLNAYVYNYISGHVEQGVFVPDGYNDYENYAGDANGDVTVKDSDGNDLFTFNLKNCSSAVEAETFSISVVQPSGVAAKGGLQGEYKVYAFNESYGSMLYDRARGVWTYNYTDGYGNNYNGATGAIRINGIGDSEVFSFSTDTVNEAIHSGNFLFSVTQTADFVGELQAGYQVSYLGKTYGAAFSDGEGGYVYTYVSSNGINRYSGASGEITIRDAGGYTLFTFRTAGVESAIASGSDSFAVSQKVSFSELPVNIVNDMLTISNVAQEQDLHIVGTGDFSGIRNNSVYTAVFTAHAGTADDPLELTLENLTLNGGISYDSSSVMNVTLNNVVMDGGVLTETAPGAYEVSALRIAAGGSAELNGVTVRGYNTSDAAFVFGSDTVLAINDSVFEENSNSSGNGGAIRFSGDLLTIADSTFSGNSAAGKGGALYVNSGMNGTLTIVDSVFENNSAEGDAGAIYTDASTMSISGSVFRSNTAAGNGGAMYIASGRNSGTVKAMNSVISATLFEGNSAANGGAVYLHTVTGAADGANTSFENVTIVRNTAAEHGGGIYVGNYSYVNIVNSTLVDNVSEFNAADKAGSALYINASVASKTNVFAYNSVFVNWTPEDTSTIYRQNGFFYSYYNITGALSSDLIINIGKGNTSGVLFTARRGTSKESS